MFVGAWLQQPPLWTGTLNMINQYECPSGFAVERMLHIFCGATCLSLHQILLNMFPVHRSVKRKALKRLQTALFEVVKAKCTNLYGCTCREIKGHYPD